RRNANGPPSTSRPSHFGRILRIAARENGPQTGLLWGTHPTFSVCHFHSDRLLAAGDVPDVRAREVPRHAALVALIGRRRELRIHEIDDAPARGGEVLHAMGNPGGDEHQPGGYLPEDGRRTRGERHRGGV